MRPVLEAKGLTKIFGNPCPQCMSATGPEYESNICPHCGSVVACGDVSFQLQRGEVLGIVGESGSGKSTLVRLLHFDWEATGGEARLYYEGEQWQHVVGKNLFSLHAFQKRQIRNGLMGIVYQNPYMALQMEVSSGGNIAERLISAGWRHVGEMRLRARELLERTEVPPERMDEPPKNFSGGMQQRVQIARALSNNPVMLFFDEVTTGLDLSVQARVLDLIRTLQAEFGLSMIVVSHDLGVVRLLTKRTLVMKHGRVVESGLTDQILEDPQHAYTQLLVGSQL